MDEQQRFVTDRTRRKRTWVMAAAALSVHVLLVVGIAVQTTPNGNEPAHLASGLYHWQTGRFDAYRVNPPLIRLWCTIPLACSRESPQLRPRLLDDGSRLEWQLDDHLMTSCSFSQFRRHLFIARIMLLPFVVAGGIYCWRWATSTYGAAAGWAAWSMWIFSPNLLAWSATVCPDVGATCFGIAACYHFRGWMLASHPGQALMATISTGLAILAKSTWILLPPLLFLVWRCAGSNRRSASSVSALVCMGLGVVMIVNLGYDNSGLMRPLGAFRFRSHLLRGGTTATDRNRFAQTPLRHLPVPLPAEFLLGLDLQRQEFEQRKWSYLGNQWRWGSWPHYYLSAAIYKMPVGFLLLLAMSSIQRVRGLVDRCQLGPTTLRRDFRLNEIVWFVPALGMGIAISSQTGFGHHFRYALPCLPFAFVYASACFRHGTSRLGQVIAWTALSCGIVSSLSAWPLSHSYFNSVAKQAFEHPPLLDSNLEWGENLAMAGCWLKIHPFARPVYHAVVTDDLARYMPIDWQPAPEPLKAGWYVVSLQRMLDPRDRYACLLERQPFARLGASLRVYRLSTADVSTLGG
jgi:hypothetical protein